MPDSTQKINGINSECADRHHSFRKVAVFLLFLFLCPFRMLAQKEDDVTDDEITVLVEVKGVGGTEMPAIIRDKEVFIPVKSVFDFLKIKNSPSVTSDSLSGFFIVQKDVFLIDKAGNRITYRDTVTQVSPGDLLKEENMLFLNLKYFKKVFAITGEFNFRRLSVTLSSDAELPAIREARQEQMRRNISRLKGEVKADTNIGRTYPAFHFGMADWALMSTQQSIGNNETRLNLGLGAVVAGGETNVSLNYSSLTQLDERQQYYQWRFVNDNSDVFRQIMAGKIFVPSISTLNAPVVGLQVTNAPTTYRKSYGTYTISNTTEPGWIVELYVNSVLVDYKKADASGFYTFEVPLIYGYSVIKLRFFGPYGEERTQQTFINIPFNFLPVHEFEYSASAGFLESGNNTVYSRGGFNYGLSSIITLGGGVEYLSSVTSGSTIPFLNTSVKIGKRMLVSGEYDYGVRARGILSYRLPSSVQIDVDLINYDKGQTAIYYNYLSERKLTVSAPLHYNLLTLFSRFSLDQITVPNARYTNGEWTLTGNIRKVGVNFSNYASFVEATSPYLYGLLSFSFILPAKINFTPQMQYDYKAAKPEFVKLTLEKQFLGKGYLNASYQQFFSTSNELYTGNYRNLLVGLRYDFSFARVAFSTLNDNQGGYSRIETASGSLIYDHKSHYLNANNRTNVGKAGITVAPFLDINCNGRRDPGEPAVSGLKLHVNGGRIIYDNKDTVIRILDLDPYMSYYLDLNKSSFDNIAWQIKNHLIKVTVSPDDLTLVQVPVAVVGEISGMVSLGDAAGKAIKGERQILLNIYHADTSLAVSILTESDGFFNFTGLAPGDYFVVIDSGQLRKLHLKPQRALLPVHISQNTEGDIIDGLEFILQPAPGAVPSSAQADTTNMTENAGADSMLKGSEPAAAKTNTGQPGATLNGGGLVNGRKNRPDKAGQSAVKLPVNRHSISGRNVEEADSVVLVPVMTDPVTGKEIIAEKGTFTIQVCALHSERSARQVQVALARKLKLPVAVVHKGTFYKPRIIGFRKNRDVRKYLPKLLGKGVKGFIIVKLSNPIYKD